MIPGRNQNRWMQPERRQRMRIVTLRNFGWLMIALLVVFGAITIRSEMRGRHMHDYGRLYDRRILPNVPRKEPAVEVVKEAAAAPQIADQTPAFEPTLVLPVDPTVESIEVSQQQATIIAPAVAPRARDSRVAIVGGPEGVAIVQKTPKRPLLSGGFGRQ